MTKDNLKIVFFGTPEFAVESLDALVKGGYNVVSVVTMPDKTGGRNKKTITSAVKDYAIANNLPLLQPEKLKAPEFVEKLQSLDADLFIVIAFRMLPEVVWKMPKLGTFNLHGSLLPRYRGAAPINRAIMAGESKTGVTTFFLRKEIDTGDIIDRVALDLDIDDTFGEVYEKLMHIGSGLTIKTVERILEGSLMPIPQSALEPEEEPCAAPKIFKEDCRIDWGASAFEIHNHVRGLSPSPAAWTILAHNNLNVKIIRTKLAADCPQLAQGAIAMDRKRVFAGTGNGSIELLTVQPAGKKAMGAPDFFRGLHDSEPRFE